MQLISSNFFVLALSKNFATRLRDQNDVFPLAGWVSRGHDRELVLTHGEHVDRRCHGHDWLDSEGHPWDKLYVWDFLGVWSNRSTMMLYVGKLVQELAYTMASEVAVDIETFGVNRRSSYCWLLDDSSDIGHAVAWLANGDGCVESLLADVDLD